MKRIVECLVGAALLTSASLAGRPATAQVYPPVNQDAKDETGRAVWTTKAQIHEINNTPEALTGKVEPPKVIKRWDASNVDEIKDMLMPTLYRRVKERGMVLNEVAYKPYTPWKPWVDATKKYAGQAKIGPDNELQGYQAGVPFPVSKRIYGDVAKFDINDPQQGLKLIHNHDQRWGGDTFETDGTFSLVDSRGGVRKLANLYSRLRLQGRVATPPMPVVGADQNPLALRFMEVAYVTFPFDLQGFFSLQYSYMDRSHQDDFYLYVPSVRRVRRASAAQRYDTFAGSDITYEDFMGFNGFPSEHTYKVIAQKPMYMARHQMYWEAKDNEHRTFKEIIVEKTPDVIIYEQYPKNPAHPYSKRVFYYDPEADQNLHWECYDRKNQLWKSYMWMYNLGGFNDNGFPYLNIAEVVDYLGDHATMYDVRHEGFPKEYGPDAFQLETLQAQGARGRQ